MFGFMVFVLVVGVWVFCKMVGLCVLQVIWCCCIVELEDRIVCVDSVFGVYFGLVVVWDELLFDEVDIGWGQFKIFGFFVVLVLLLWFVEVIDGFDFVVIFMEGFVDYEVWLFFGEEMILC